MSKLNTLPNHSGSIEPDKIALGIENVFVPIYVVTPEGEIVFASKGCARLTKLSVEELIGRKCYEVFNSNRCQTPGCPLNLYKEKTDACMDDKLYVEVTLPSGETRYLRAYHAPIASNGKLWGVIEVLEDFTEVKESVTRTMDMISSLIRGDFSKTLRTSELHEDFREIGETLNVLNIVLELGLRNISDAVKQIAEGKFSEVEWDMPGIYAEITNNINQAIKQINITLHEIQDLCTAIRDGDLSKMIDVSKLTGVFAEIGERINEMSIALELGLRNTSDAVKQIAEGKFSEVEWDMPGIYAEITNNINQAIKQINITLHEIQDLCTAIRDGDLSKMIDVSKLTGVFAEIGERINDAIKHVYELNNLLKVLSEINELVARERNPEIVLKAVCEKLSLIYDAVFTSLGSRKEELKPVRSKGIDIDSMNRAIKYCPSISKALDGQIMKLKMDDKLCRHCTDKPHKYVLSIPLIHDVLHGVITIHSSSDFSEDEIELLQKLSSNIAFALSAYEVEKDREKLNNLLKVLSEINELVARERNPEIVLKAVCEKLSLIYDAVFTSLGSRKEELKPVRSKGIDIDSMNRAIKYCPSISKALDGQIMKLKMDDKLCRHCTDKPHKYVLSIPLIHDVLHGVITIHSSSDFSEDEIELLQKLSSNIAFALSAYEVEKDREKAIEQLAANLKQFESSADRLRNPLAVIMGSLELVDELGKDKVFEIIREHVKRIKDELDDMRKEEIKTYKLTEKIYSTLTSKK
ncbi:GAF domain-containing protein [Archaeoglobus veneficus]|uniref:PAS sensor protein n=1 Tax=Archaeoglobus veneficus (strain DSM 11195 / SNP6) TaxID=693661 RepID=F2KQC8_ARCVS|nr:GAF domain-containing protein [Archaeoglobus veneficus]AEA46561.1 PAS sensor protein [Archaeoglobus veneficus SNP6]